MATIAELEARPNVKFAALTIAGEAGEKAIGEKVAMVEAVGRDLVMKGHWEVEQ